MSKLVSYTCQLGSPIAAMNYAKFEDSLDGLSEADQKLLRAAWISTCTVADGDAGLEVAIIRKALCRLRDELAK